MFKLEFTEVTDTIWMSKGILFTYAIQYGNYGSGNYAASVRPIGSVTVSDQLAFLENNSTLEAAKTACQEWEDDVALSVVGAAQGPLSS